MNPKIFFLILVFLTYQNLCSQELEINIQIPKQKIHLGESLIVNGYVKNNSEKSIRITSPSVDFGSVYLTVIKDGTEIGQYVMWCGAGFPNTTELEPKDSADFSFDIMWLYNYLLDSGEYQILAKYTVDKDATIHSNLIPFQIVATSEETQAKSQYITALQSGTNKADISVGEQFLKNYPQGYFSVKMRIRMANSFINLKQYEESMEILKPALKSDFISEWERREVLNLMGWNYYYMDDLPKAILILESVSPSNQNVKSLIRNWKRKLGERN